jgi:hypothetical protein
MNNLKKLDFNNWFNDKIDLSSKVLGSSSGAKALNLKN